ncbi:hypothetical protein ABPG72_018438 [Tetrahymena utriculariae]
MKKKKKTIAGGLISITVLIISMIYFVYLCYLYFQNKIQPSVVLNNMYQKDPFSMSFQQDFISIQIILPNGQNLYDYQKATGKVYLNMISNHYTNVSSLVAYPLVLRADPLLQGYMCFDESKYGDGNSQFEFLYNPANIEQNKFHIYFTLCDQQTNPSPYICEDDQGIDQVQDQIKKADFKKLGKQMKISIFKRIWYFFNGEVESDEKETNSVKLYWQIIDQSQKAINIFEIQKELLQMKLMMRLMLSVEQYAAIQLCESSLPLFQELKDEQFSQQKENQKDICEQEVKNYTILQNKEEKQSDQFKSQSNILSNHLEKPSIQKGSSTVYPIQVNQTGKKFSEMHQKQLKTNILNHLEKIDMIDSNQGYFKQCLDKFFENQNQNQTKSKVDKRIIECITGLDDSHYNNCFSLENLRGRKDDP